MSQTREVPRVPPGWYDDPMGAGGKRYWDGNAWTQQVASAPSRVSPTMLRPEKEQQATGVVITGYIFAVLIPIVGLIIGLTQMSKNRHGVWIVLVAVASFVVSLMVLGGGGG